MAERQDPWKLLTLPSVLAYPPFCPSSGLEPWWAGHGLGFGVSNDTRAEIMNSWGRGQNGTLRAEL